MKKTIITVGTVAVMTFGGMFVTDGNVAHANTELNDVQDQQSSVKSKMSKAETEIAEILKEMESTNKEINRLEVALEQNDKEIKKNEKKIKDYNKKIDKLNEKIEQRNEILKERISAYQDNGGNLHYIDVLLGSESFSDLIGRVEILNTISASDADLIAENEADKEEVKVSLEKVEEIGVELDYQNEIISTQKTSLKDKKSSLKSQESKANKKLAKLENKSSELAALENEIKESIAQQERALAQTNSDDNNSSNSNSIETTNTSSNSSSDKSESKSKKKESNNVAYTGAGGSAISAGQKYIGNSTYSLGASNPAAGLFDCSSFVQWAYAQEGISLPRTTHAQVNAGTRVSYSDAQPGDLIFFDNAGANAHVGIYMGGGKWLGAQTSTGVAVASVNDPYYWGKYFNGTVVRVK